MSFKNYKNIPVTIDNKNIIANDVSIQISNEVSPLYLAEQRHSFSYFPQNSVTSNISLTYFLTGKDIIKERFVEDRNLALTENVITGNIGGLFFNSGYLTSYSINGQQNQPVSVTAQILVFDDIHGSLNNIVPTLVDKNIKPLNTSDCSLTIYNTNAKNYSNIISFSYNYSADVKPFYVMSNVNDYENLMPANVHYGQKQIISTIVTDDTSGILRINGDTLAYRVGFNDINSQEREFIYSSGILSNKNIQSKIKDITTNTLTIQQHYIQQPPVIEAVSSLSGNHGELIQLYGQNLYPTTELFFGDIRSEYIVQFTQNGIQARIPEKAISGKLKIRTFGGEYTFPSGFIPNDNGITINGLSSWVGGNNENIIISGSNFYSLSRVLFGNISSDFKTINSTKIKTSVPTGFTKEYIHVISDARNKSGQSVEKFTALPIITSFIPETGVSGSLVTISGLNFTGVTNISFNNINVTGYDLASISNNRIITYCPSGNVFGPIKITESQLSTYYQNDVFAVSPYNFKPYIKLTGIFPASGYAYDTIRISGVNLYGAFLQKTTGPAPSNILVNFNGGVTGFQLIEPDTLVGQVPNNAVDGPISIYAFQGEISLDSFDRTYEAGSVDDPEFVKKNDPPMILYTARPTIQYGGSSRPDLPQWSTSPYHAGVKLFFVGGSTYLTSQSEVVVYNYYPPYGHASSDLTVPADLRNSNENYSYPAKPAIWPIEFRVTDTDTPYINPGVGLYQNSVPIIRITINGKNFFNVNNVLITGIGTNGINRYWYCSQSITTGGYIKNYNTISNTSNTQYIEYPNGSPTLYIPESQNGTIMEAYFPVTLYTTNQDQEFLVIVNALEGSSTGNAYWRLNRKGVIFGMRQAGFQPGDFGYDVKLTMSGDPNYPKLEIPGGGFEQYPRFTNKELLYGDWSQVRSHY